MTLAETAVLTVVFYIKATVFSKSSQFVVRKTGKMYRAILVLAVAVACVVGTGDIFPMKPDEIAKTKEIEQGIEMGVEMLNAKNNRNENKYRMVRDSIKRATRQVVSGMIFRVEIGLVATSCLNTDANANKDKTDCPAIGNGVARYCTLSIWSRPWLKDESKRLIVNNAIHCTVN